MAGGFLLEKHRETVAMLWIGLGFSDIDIGSFGWRMVDGIGGTS
jgi:hypothetical protein